MKSNLKASLTRTLKEAKMQVDADETRDSNIKSLKESIDTMRVDSDETYVVTAKLLKEALNGAKKSLKENYEMKEDMEKFGNILDQILELIVEFKGGDEPEGGEVVEEAAAPGIPAVTEEAAPAVAETTVVPEAAPAVAETTVVPEAAPVAEIQQAVATEAQITPIVTETKVEAKPPVQMESGLNGANDKILKENVVVRKMTDESCLSGMF